MKSCHFKNMPPLEFNKFLSDLLHLCTKHTTSMNLITQSEHEMKATAQRKLPRGSDKPLMDYPPGERDGVLRRWSIRESILVAREYFAEAKRLKKEIRRNRKKKVDVV